MRGDAGHDVDDEAAMTEINVPLPCLVCGKELESVFGPALPTALDVELNQPYGGTVFMAHGQYGSTVFDPITARGSNTPRLEVNICDPCLLEAAQLQRVLYVEREVPAPPPKIRYVVWNGES